MNLTALYEVMQEDYKRRNKELNVIDSPKNWLCYLLSRGKIFDLDFTFLFFGYARSGKSTAMLDLERRIEAYKKMLPLKQITDELLFNIAHIKQTYIFSPKEFTKLAELKDSILKTDEASLVLDRRKSMDRTQVNFLSKLNANAKNNNINFIAIQNYNDIDERIIRKSNGTFFQYERGSMLCFLASKNFAFLLGEGSDFKDYSKERWLFHDLRRGVSRLRQRWDFYADLPVPDLRVKYPEGWKNYSDYKDSRLNENESL